MATFSRHRTPGPITTWWEMTETTNVDDLIGQLGEIHKEHQELLGRLGLIERATVALADRVIIICALLCEEMIKSKRTPRKSVHPPKSCTHPGCDRKYFAAGLCRAHYARKNIGADMDKPIVERKSSRPTVCSHPGCNEPHKALGLCRLHYTRHKKGLDLDAPLFGFQRKKKESKQPKQKSTSIGHPVELSATVKDIKDHRCYDCPALENCKAYAEAKGWRQFSCNDCGGPGTQKKSRGKYE